MWNTITTTFDEPEDIVDRLIHADQEHRKSIEAMIKGELTGKSIFLEAAEQIVALRNILGITGN
jgi:arginine utilization protein RocB